MSKTIWRVGPDGFLRPVILTRCPECNANGELHNPPEMFMHAGRQWKGSVALGLQWARDFRLVHAPGCPTLSAQHAPVEAAENELDGPRHQIYLLEQAVSQAARALDRAYLSKLPVVELSQLSDKLQAANITLAQGSARLAPLIAALERKLADAQAVLENARPESVPEKTLAEFGAGLARYLPAEWNPQQPVPPGEQRKPQVLHV